MEVVARIAGDASGAVGAFQQASDAAQQFQKDVKKTSDMLIAMGAAIGGVGIAVIGFGKKAFDEAARVSELDVAMQAIGKSTGVGAVRLKEAAKSIKSMGIETAASQKMAIEYAQGNLDLAVASKVARVAQDLAVISQKNSTDTAMLLTRAIKTGNSMLLKSAGVSRQASEGYEMYAKQLGKSQTELSATERQQAIVNLILDEGAKVAGVYEAAMTEAGKVLRSFPRLFNDIQVAIGGAIIDGLGPVILATYDVVKAFAKAISEGGKLYPIVEALTIVFKEMFEPVIAIAKGIENFIKGLQLTQEQVPAIAAAIQQLLPLVGALAAGLSALAGKSLLGNLPVIGRFAMMLNPIAIGLGTLIFLTPQLRDQVIALFAQVKKIIPPLLALAYAVARAGSEFLDEFIVPLATTMINLLKPAIDAVVKVLSVFKSDTESATNVVEALKLGLVILTGVYVGLKVVQLAQIAVSKAQAIWSGILTAATFILILATDGLAAAFAALGVAITATGIGAIIVVIGLVIAAMVAWYQKSMWFRNTVKQVFEAVVNAFIFVLNGFLRYINTLFAVSAKVMNFLIGIYNKVAAIVGLPKINPVDPVAIPLLKSINIELETMNKKLTINYGLMYKLEQLQKKENRARADAAGWLEAWNKKVEEEREKLEGSGAAADKKAQKLKELKDRTLDYVKNALEKAREALEREKTAMEEYAQSVSRAITESLSLSGAFQEMERHQQAQTQAIERQTQALENYANTISNAIERTMSLSGVLDAQRRAADDLQKAQDGVTKANAALLGQQERYAEKVAAAQERVDEAMKDVVEAARDAEMSERSKLAVLERYINATKNLQKVKDDTKDIAEAQAELAAATERSNAAQAAQMTFLERLAKQAEQAKGFADRIRKLAEAGLSKTALDQIVSAGAEAGTTIADELLKGGATAVSRTNELFKQMQDVAETTGMDTAKRFMQIGEKVGFDLIAAFNKQAEEATVFADRVRQLTEAGLSKEAIAMVLQAGVKAGTQIADYLLVAGEDRIMKANNIVLGLKKVGDTLGELLGKTFFSAGVTLADQVVKGLESQLKEVEAALKKLEDIKAARDYMKAVIARTDEAVKPLETLKPETITGKPDTQIPILPVDNIAAALAASQGTLDFSGLSQLFGNFTPMAKGGIVSKPTLALIGEAGPEAVVPLNRTSQGMAGGDIYLTVNAGMGANGRDIGQEIVEQLSRWQRRNGALPLTVV